MRKVRTVLKLKNTIKKYIRNNLKEYILVSLIYIIGIVIGVMFVNNYSTEQSTNVSNYIIDFTNNFKNIENIDYFDNLIKSIKNNIFLTLVIWFAGTTIIGMPLVLGIIMFRGYCLGYTVSSISLALGLKNGFIFCFVIIFLKNIIFIPAILTLGVSSIKLYKSIIADKRKENIKIEIIRHTFISLIMIALLILSSFIENQISIRLLQCVIKYL